MKDEQKSEQDTGSGRPLPAYVSSTRQKKAAEAMTKVSVTACRYY